MIRHVLLFLLTFAIGATAAVVVRTAGHHPHDRPAPPVPAPAPAPAPEAPPAPAPVSAAPVNTTCPGCGGPVNPAIPTERYQGKVIGFNCAMCLPKFRAEPAKYGEAALKNVMAE